MNVACHNSRKGSLLLLVMCLLAVLGIMLAGYLSVSNQAMKLSNRAAQTAVSEQLAEMGLSEALRAFSTNNWTSWSSNGTTATWSTSGTTASCTISLPSTKYGNSGTTASVKIRVDNYNTYNLPAAWVGGNSYQINDLVGYNGIWYRCVKAHSTTQTPDTVGTGTLAYWVPAPIPWQWRANSSYRQYEMVNYLGVWYRCTASHTSPASWTGANWSSVSSIKLYSPSDAHAVGDIVYNPDSTTWYRCTTAGTPGSFNATAQTFWQWSSGTNYQFNDVVCVYDSSSATYIWYRYIYATATSNHVPPNATYWENALSGTMHAWSSSSINYNIGDAVYYSVTAKWYRCIQAHTSSASLTPTSTTYWNGNPLLSKNWDSGRQYAQNDTVSYNGVWYLSIFNGSNVGNNPATATTYWIGANTSNSSYTWNSSSNYSVGDYRCYGGVWYKCLTAGPNQTPNNSTYWTDSWVTSWGVTTGAPVVYAEGSVTLPDSTAVIKTQLRAAISRAPLFPNALAATTGLTISTATGMVDSFDSGQGTYASQTPGYSAVLASGSTLAINGTTAVSGYLAWPSPPSGISSNSTVWGPSSPASPKVDPTRLSRSPYIPQFDTQPSGGLSAAFSAGNFPKGTLLPTGATSVLNSTTNIGTPGSTTPSRYYYNGNLSLTTNGVLNINGPVIVYCNGNLRTNAVASALFNITNTGSAEFHANGAVREDAGSGGFYNQTLDPKKMILISDSSSNTTAYLGATAHDFYGVVYSPNTTATLGLNVNTSGVNIYGALSAKNITFSNEATVHYDTSLRYASISGVDQPYAITEWRELTDPAEKANLP